MLYMYTVQMHKSTMDTSDRLFRFDTANIDISFCIHMLDLMVL